MRLNFICNINTSHIQSQLASHRGCTDLTVHAIDIDQEQEDHLLIQQLYSKNDSLRTQVSELRHIAQHYRSTINLCPKTFGTGISNSTS